MNNTGIIIFLLILAITEFVGLYRTKLKCTELKRRINALTYKLEEIEQQKNILLAKIEDIKELFED